MAVRPLSIPYVRLLTFCSCQGIISMMVQFFYAWRIQVLTKNWWVVAVVALSSTVSGGTLLPHVLDHTTHLPGCKCALLARPSVSQLSRISVNFKNLMYASIGISWITIPNLTSQVIALPWLISCTLCDVMIAVALSLYLVRALLVACLSTCV
jgi:hypothetical protein